MDTEHGARLSPVDAAFLSMESPTRHMHAGGLFVFEPAVDQPFEFDRFVRTVDTRLDLVPRYRRRLAFTPLGLGAPVWIDDPDFDLSYHVRHVAAPAPGDTAELTTFCARILSRPLDRTRPLWELYVIEGLADGRFAVFAKNHHAMVGGDGGLDLATVLLDTEAQPEPSAGGSDWRPAPPPGDLDLVRAAVVDAVSAPGAVLDLARRVADTPLRAAGSALRATRGLLEVATRNLARPAPPTLLNREPGPHRRVAVQRLELEDVKLVKDAFGTSVNDVVLSIVSDATGRLLRRHGANTDRAWLRVLCPVAVPAEADERQPLGNRVVSGLVDLPVFEMDPVERLRTCQRQMEDVVDRQEPVGAEFLLGLGQFAPPTLHGLAARLAARTRLFNFLVTNVPGPQRPVYCLGARLRAAFPFPPLSGSQTYAVGATSIGGSLNIGVTADYAALPDVDTIGADLAASLAEHVASARAKDTHADLAQVRVDGAGVRRQGADPGSASAP